MNWKSQWASKRLSGEEEMVLGLFIVPDFEELSFADIESMETKKILELYGQRFDNYRPKSLMCPRMGIVVSNFGYYFEQLQFQHEIPRVLEDLSEAGHLFMKDDKYSISEKGYAAFLHDLNLDRIRRNRHFILVIDENTYGIFKF
jgi:hypothetical protein